MTLVLKTLIGALLALVIALLSRTKNFYVAGLVILFPSFTLLAHYIVGMERTHAELKSTIIFGAWSIIPYCTYMLAVYFLVDRVRLETALLCAALAWGLVAAILLVAWAKYYAGAN